MPSTTTTLLAIAVTISPLQNVAAASVCARVCAFVCAARRRRCAARCAPARRTPDDRRTHDRLGHRTEHLADPLTHRPVRRLQTPLEHAKQQGERDHAGVDSQRQLPRPPEHQDGREHHLSDRDDDEDPADCMKVLILSTSLVTRETSEPRRSGGLVQHRQVVDPPEARVRRA